MPTTVLGLLIALGVYVLLVLWQRYKPVPANLHGPPPETFRVRAERVTLWFDTTRFEGDRAVRESRIVDRVLEKLGAADRAVLDVFLLDVEGTGDMPRRPDTRRLAEAVRRGGGDVLVIADPVNTQYGTAGNPPFEWLEAAGARVVEADLGVLRHNNLLVAPLYPLAAPLLPRRRTVRDPTDGRGKVSPYAIATAVTARGDHRKVLVTRSGGACSALVASSNLADSTAWYDNVAVEIADERVARFLLTAERALAEASGARLEWSCGDGAAEAPAREGEAVEVTPLMGAHIGRAVRRDLAGIRPGDRVVVGVLFLSSRACVRALVAAQRRGAEVHVVLDNNQASFGADAGGFPNRVVARELLSAAPGIDLRWHRTDVEFHSKLVWIARGDRRIVHAGSANLTRRSLCGTNLETNLRLELPSACAAARDVDDYVEALVDDASSRPVSPEQGVPRWWRVAYLVGERIGMINC